MCTGLFGSSRHRRTVEILTSKMTASAVIGNCKKLVLAMSKIPIVSQGGNNSIVISMMNAMRAEAARLVEEGASPTTIDAVLRDRRKLFAEGVFARMDNDSCSSKASADEDVSVEHSPTLPEDAAAAIDKHRKDVVRISFGNTLCVLNDMYVCEGHTAARSQRRRDCGEMSVSSHQRGFQSSGVRCRTIP